MRHIKWYKEMPDVPEEVHNRVLFTLSQLEKEEAELKDHKTEKKDFWSRSRKYVAAAAILVVCGTTAVAAASVTRWNEKAAEEFHSPQLELQEKLMEEGVALEQGISVTDSKITVKAVQTLKDSNRIYMLFDVTSEENVIDGSGNFDQIQICDENGKDLMGEDRPHSAGGAFTDDSRIGVLGKQGYYFWDLLFDEGYGWDGTALTVTLTDFSYYTFENGMSDGRQTPHRIEGTWTLEIPFADHAGDAKTYELNREVTIHGMPVTVHSVMVSPLSVTICYDLESTLAMQEAVYGKEGDGYIPLELYAYGFLDMEGNKVPMGTDGSTGEYTDSENRITVGLTQPIDAGTVKAIFLGPDEVQVDLR